MTWMNERLHRHNPKDLAIAFNTAPLRRHVFSWKHYQLLALQQSPHHRSIVYNDKLNFPFLSYGWTKQDSYISFCLYRHEKINQKSRFVSSCGFFCPNRRSKSTGMYKKKKLYFINLKEPVPQRVIINPSVYSVENGNVRQSVQISPHPVCLFHFMSRCSTDKSSICSTSLMCNNLICWSCLKMATACTPLICCFAVSWYCLLEIVDKT